MITLIGRTLISPKCSLGLPSVLILQSLLNKRSYQISKTAQTLPRCFVNPHFQIQCNWLCYTISHSFFHTICKPKKIVLGIETSCDDTGAAIVDNNGNVLGEALDSQTSVHNETGGIVPIVAKELHEKKVQMIVEQALDDAKMKIKDVDAIAVTVEPGLIMSLRVGMKYAVNLAKSSGRPLIPIHHMQAHALTARMIKEIDFPFLVLLASGGHCLLTIAQNIDKFLILGSKLDIAPGDAIDKTVRETNLHTLPQFHNVSFGAILEQTAKNGNPYSFEIIHPMKHQKHHQNCDFTFAGLGSAGKRKIREEYKRQNLPEDEILPNVSDICAWFQHIISVHIMKRVQRGLMYSDVKELFGEQKTLVISGGVASNVYLRSCLKQICDFYNYELVCPPIKLCTDNGIMIAWNGMEKLLSGRDFSQNPDCVDVTAKSPIGEDISKDVLSYHLKLDKFQLDKSFLSKR